MNNFFRLFGLMLLMSSASAQSNLPPCTGSVFTWNDCKGTEFFPGGDKYTGEFKAGRFNGRGTYYFLAPNQSEGNIFIGEFIDGMYNGIGIEFNKNGAVINSGKWRNSQIVDEFPINPSIFGSLTEALPTQTAQQPLSRDSKLQILSAQDSSKISRIQIGAAESKVGDVLKDKFITEDGYVFPLPKGEWVFRQLSDGRNSNSVSWKGRILVNLDQASLTRILVIQYSATSQIWGERHCNLLKEKNNYFSKHGSVNTSLVNRCSAFTFTNSNSATSTEFSTGNNEEILRAFIQNYFEKQSPTQDPLAVSTFLVDRNNGKRFVLTTISTYPAGNVMSAISRFSKADSVEYNAMASWHDQYMVAIEESLINKKFQSFAEFDASSNLKILFASSVPKETGNQKKLVAALNENTSQKVPSISQEDPFEAARKQAENEFAEDSLAQEVSRNKELERLLVGSKAKEEIRLAEEARNKEQQRLALEAQQKEQLRLAQEARQKEQERLVAEQQAKEQLRLAEEARIKNQQRLAIESTEIGRLRAEAEESKRKQAELEEQLKLAKQQYQVSSPSAMTTVANRKALVIGNDTYKSVSKLLNAREDAKAIAASLSAVGYQVTLKLDLNEKEMKAALRAFSSQVQGGDEVMFFFAGHGVQLGAANYLLPIDIGGESEAQVKDEAIQLQRILDDMSEKKSKFTLAMIDACRDNPFKTTGRAIGGRGMAPTTAATGQMVVFSAGTGQQALDRLGINDKSKNGLFTRTFLKEMQKSGVSIDRIVKNVRNEVAELARSVGHEQVPAIYDQVLGDFFFKK